MLCGAGSGVDRAGFRGRSRTLASSGVIRALSERDRLDGGERVQGEPPLTPGAWRGRPFFTSWRFEVGQIQKCGHATVGHTPPINRGVCLSIGMLQLMTRWTDRRTCPTVSNGLSIGRFWPHTEAFVLGSLHARGPSRVHFICGNPRASCELTRESAGQMEPSPQKSTSAPKLPLRVLLSECDHSDCQDGRGPRG